MRIRRGLIAFHAVCLILALVPVASGQRPEHSRPAPSERRTNPSETSEQGETRPARGNQRIRPTEGAATPALADAPAVIGKVTAYEAGRSITLETVTRAGATGHEFTIVPDRTRIELPPRNKEITVGSTLAVWADNQLVSTEPTPLLDDALTAFERTLILAALRRARGRRQKAAKLLGWGRNTLTRKIKELGLES